MRDLRTPRDIRSAGDERRGPRPAILSATALCLVALLAGGAGAGQFGPPRALTHPDPPIDGQANELGREIALDGDTLAIAGRTQRRKNVWEDELFIYQRKRSDPAGWRLSRRVVISRLGSDSSLALDGGTLAVATDWGSVHIYERDAAGVWRRQRTLRPKLPGFAGPIALDGDRLVVGLPTRLFEVVVFERNRPARGRWGLTTRLQGKLTSPAFRQPALLPALEKPAAGFGQALAVSGDRLAVGAVTLGPCCGKGGPNTHSIFIFARDADEPSGWRQLHNFAAPGRRDLSPAEEDLTDAPFGLFVDLSGPFLLAGEGLVSSESPTSRTRMHLYERNHHGPDGWGYRGELRRGRASDNFFMPQDSDLRGNTAAVIETATRFPGGTAVQVFERDFPARNRWGLKASLPIEPPSSPRVALGPRELVVGAASTDTVLIYPRAPLVAGDFDGPALAGWTGSRGPIQTVSPGLGGSDAALAVALGGAPSWVASNRPSREPLVSIRFALQPNAVNLARQRVEILRLFAGQPALRLSLEESDEDPMYRAQLEIRGLDGAWKPMGRARLLPDRESTIGIEYQAPTAAGAANGFVRFEVNGHLVRQAKKLAVDRMLIGRVVLGLPVGSPPEASGSFLVDGFEMHR